MKIAEPVEIIKEPACLDHLKEMAAGCILKTSALLAVRISELFFCVPLSDSLFAAMMGVSFHPNDTISRIDLRYLKVLHIGFDQKVHIGELVVHCCIADEILEIMRSLFASNYQIEKMVLIDRYDGDDNRSMEDNNSSGFNFRVIAGTSRISKHGLGMAIDINPQYNPYIRTGICGEMIVEPSCSIPYTDRSLNFEHKIDEKDLCYQLFLAHGYCWGGNFTTIKDYQHFEK